MLCAVLPPLAAQACIQPAIDAQPEDLLVLLGLTRPLGVSATGTDLSYQWYFGVSGDTSRRIDGATSATIPAGPPASELFWVRVGNDCGSVDSTHAVVGSYTSLVAGPDAVRLRPRSMAWRMIGAGDFNGDSEQDILLQNDDSGELVVWSMFRPAVVSTENFLSRQPVSPAWRAVLVADFNDDARPDILLQNADTREIYVWTMSSTESFVVADTDNYVGTSSPGWKVRTAADLDGDSNQDLILVNAGTHENVIWRLAGFSVIDDSTFLPDTTPGWEIAAAGDITADGNPDLFVRNAKEGLLAVWPMQGHTVLSTDKILSGRIYDPAWRIVSAADWDGDGTAADLLWAGDLTDESAVILMGDYLEIYPRRWVVHTSG